MTIIAINSRQIAQLLKARANVDYNYRDIYMRLTQRNPDFCPVKPSYTAITKRKNAVVISIDDYPAFESWIADRAIGDCPYLTIQELISVGFTREELEEIAAKAA